MSSPIGWRDAAVIAPGAAFAVALLLQGPIPQDPEYHAFADQRTVWGIARFGDVATNLGFVITGAMGLRFLLGRGRGATATPFREPAESTPYTVFFMGVFLTGFGSGWYHLNPTSDSLFWDRLPLTFAFMAFFSVVIAERASVRVGRKLFLPLLVFGGASVVYWTMTERAGAGDLRLYALVQFYPMAAIPLLLLLYRSRFTEGARMWAVAAAYAAAKLLELLDHQVWALTGQVVSGHNAKHVAASLAPWFLLRMLRARRPASDHGSSAMSQ